MGRLYRYVSQNLPRCNDVLRRRAPIFPRHSRERPVLLDRFFRYPSFPARAGWLDAQDFQRPHDRRVEVAQKLMWGQPPRLSSRAQRAVAAPASSPLAAFCSTTEAAKSKLPGPPPPAPNKSAAGTPSPPIPQSAARTTASATKARESVQIFLR